MAKKEKAPKAPEAETEVEGEEGAPAKKKLAGKTLILFIVLPAVLLLGGGGAAAYFLFFNKPPATELAEGELAEGEHASDTHGEEKDAKAKKDDHGKKDDGHGKKDDGHGKKDDGHGGDAGMGGTLRVGAEGDPSYYTLPDLMVNFTGAGGRASFLKLRLTLESEDASVFEAVEPVLPRIIDQYQVFLRELRADDLSGSAGAYRLRLELLRRVNLAIAPRRVDAVLIEEMLIQ
jgi:flagellar protein FliL